MPRSVREGRSLLSIGNAVGEALYLSEERVQILSSVLDKLIEGLNIDCAWIQMVEKDGTLSLVGCRGFNPEILAETQSIKPGQGITGQVAATGESVIIPDIAADARHLVSGVKAGFHSLAAIPMKTQGGTRGIIGVASRETALFDSEVVELLSVLGNHINIALDRAILYEQARAREMALSESEIKFRTLFEEAGDAAFLTDAERGVILDANREAERLLGLPASAIAGMHHSQLHLPDRADQYRAILRRYAEAEHVVDIEGEVVRKDGTVVPVLMGSRIIHLKGKKLVQLTFKNIAEVKEAERQARIKDSAIASSMSPISLTDLKGKLTYVNSAFLKLWGYEHERELLGRHALSIWKAGGATKEMADTFAATGRWAGELVAVRKDGSLFDTHVSLSTVTDEVGKPICLMGTCLDVTERKLNEAKICEQSLTLNVISELARVISSDANINEIFESFARQLRNLLAFDRLSISTIEGDKVKFFAVSSKEKTEFNSGTTIPLESSATGWVARHRKTLIESDLVQGSQFPFDRTRLRDNRRSSIHVPLLSHGRVFGSLNLSSLRANAFGEKDKEILEQLAVQIAGAVQMASLYGQERAHSIELEKQKQEWTSFTGIVAQELKTPMSAIIAAAELLGEGMKEKASEAEHRQIQNIIRIARRLEAGLDELIEMTEMKGVTPAELTKQNTK